MMPYTQADHDRATELGGVGIIVTVVLVAAILVLAVVA